MTLRKSAYVPDKARCRSPKRANPNTEGYTMPREKENLDWEMVDTDDFTGPLAKAYKAWRASQDESNLHKETLIDLMTESKSVKKACPAGEKPRFNFRWGNWYIAFAPMTGKKKASGGFRM